MRQRRLRAHSAWSFDSGEIRGPHPDLGGAFSAIVKEHAGALLVFGDTLVFSYRMEIAALATRHRVPAMVATREFAQAGGLMSYGPSASDLFRRAAVYVDISKHVGRVKSQAVVVG